MCSFRGPYANRGSGTERASSDDVGDGVLDVPRTCSNVQRLYGKGQHTNDRKKLRRIRKTVRIYRIFCAYVQFSAGRPQGRSAAEGAPAGGGAVFRFRLREKKKGCLSP